MPRNTNTNLFGPNGVNKTGTALSTNIVILVEGNVVGAVQSLQVTEARPGIKMIDEVGTDGHIDSAPNGSTNYNGTCSRVRFDRIRIAEAFSRSFSHVKSQRIPFDIEIHDYFHDADTGNAVITVLQNVWIERISYTYGVSDWIILDEMTWQAEDIKSTLADGNLVVGTTASGKAVNVIEQEADVGVYRGSLDAPGLLNAFGS